MSNVDVCVREDHVAAGFVQRFSALWRDPYPAGFAPMFHPDATILWPGMPQPLAPEDMESYFRDVVLPILPDIRLAVQRWANAGEVVFIEWLITGTRDGAPVSFPGVDRFVLRDDKATEMRAFFDTALLMAG